MQRRMVFFGVLTNVKDLSADEVITSYKELWKIEDAFGEFLNPAPKIPIIP